MKNKNKKNKPLTPQQIEMALRPLTDEQMESLTKNELLILLKGEQKLRQQFEDMAKQAAELQKETEIKLLEIEGRMAILKSRILTPKSEKSEKEDKTSGSSKKPPPLGGRPRTKRKLTERYPNALVLEKKIELETPPDCMICNLPQVIIGYEESQCLGMVPAQFIITVNLRAKYSCGTKGCNGDCCRIVTAPVLPRIVPRSAYSDELLIDVTLSKFCDLIPIERYCDMAARKGFEGLPPTSFHELIWRFGIFLNKVYELIRVEALDARILSGDETTLRMLEGDKKKHWYFWGFFSSTACFYESHNTRSGDIAGDILSESGCEYFMSDAYSGYSKAIREANELRELAGQNPIIELLCNAHARRYFVECDANEEAETFVAEYREIYKNEDEVQRLLSEDKILEATEQRALIQTNFDRMKEKTEEGLNKNSSHSQYYKACQYFINNFTRLTICSTNPCIPLDNNHSERGLRTFVVGRKTWYGFHSVRAAEAATIHFTIIETCKLNKVNPREYYKDTVESIHFKRPLLTPFQYKLEKLKK